MTLLADTAVEPPGPDFENLFFAGPKPDLQFSFGAASHVGRVRTQNEDHFAILRMRRNVDVMREV